MIFVIIHPITHLLTLLDLKWSTVEDGSTTNSELKDMLRSRDVILRDARMHLLKAQEQMKNNSDKKRSELRFEVDSSVFLKLRPYLSKPIFVKSWLLGTMVHSLYWSWTSSLSSLVAC